MDAKLLGVRIREARERLGLSQEELAAAVSRDQGAISEYESGKRRLSVVDLPVFAKTLQVPLLYFFEGDVTESDVERMLINEFRQLPTLAAKQAMVDVMHILSTRLVTSSNQAAE